MNSKMVEHNNNSHLSGWLFAAQWAELDARFPEQVQQKFLKIGDTTKLFG
ncbi:hypothetical protein SAMN05421788_10562 [Filimonas lacunae]|uniref:Uncharacterized protein n=1 Tax=Filimonas lacunae TaxID=477680 RepID=A0A173MDA5_9BACT|nr:hypothetical protein [Filimonas lacunae]BAV05486.1 hypothetical protein FLA_1493 [Filimonas lacunae]SIT20784.1 hypothetical protein SAMN05421788_10562 [Filimonas lacunae]